GEFLVQARGPFWRKAIGAGKEITVVLGREGDSLTVQLGNGKWIDKAVAMGVGMFALPVALIPAIIGSVGQARLPSQTIEFIRGAIPLCTPAHGSDEASPMR